MTKAKSKAKKRDGEACKFCGITNEQHTEEYRGGLHAHHIIKDGDGGQDIPENYITVCRDCHKILENTQADALSRIKDQHAQQARTEARADCEVRIKELEETISNLIRTVHGLERSYRDPESLANRLENERVSFHTVSAIKSAKAQATSEKDKALEWYDDWGMKMRHDWVYLSEDDAQEIAENVIEERTGSIEQTLEGLQ